MAAIREELILADRFSATFTRYTNMLRQSTSASTMAAASQKQFDTASRQAGDALVRMAGAALDAASAMEDADAGTSQLAGSCERAAKSQDKVNYSLKQGQSAASGLESRLLSLAKAYLGVRTAQAFIDLTDTFTQTTARLNRMNDGLQDTAELQDMIYRAAQRSRGAYQETADMVAKLGTLAPDAFNSSGEIVAFAEQINKQFALAGTDTQGQQAAMLQLTQALSSGTLRGEELNSVLENAPTIAQAISRYMGVTTGEMRELASEGQVTAQVVKNALFAAADETNAAFENIPLTFGQAWTMAGNAAIKAMQPAMTKLNDLLNSEIGRKAVNGLIAGFELLGSAASSTIDLLAMGAQWVADNWDMVSAVLIGTAIGIAGFMAASAIKTAIVWAAANWPLLLIAGSIALIIYMLREMGMTWEEIGGIVGGVCGMMYASTMNTFIVPAQNMFAHFANFVGNLFHDPVAAVKVLFLDLATTVLGYLKNVAHGIEDLINKIPGLHVNLTSGIDNVYDMVKGASQKVKDASGWKEYVKAWDWVDYSNAWNNGAAKGSGVGKALDEFNIGDLLSGFSGSGTDYSAMIDNSGIPDTLGDISADTAAKAQSMLSYYNRRWRTLKASSLGIVGLRAGQMLMMDVPNLGDINLFALVLLEKVTHTFEHDTHTMDFEVRQLEVA